MLLRDERSDDISRISHIHYTAFKGHPVHAPGAEPCEHLIVERLRADGALPLSLLAEIDGQAVGHIALSPAVIGNEPEGWYLLGPLGVLPGNQGQGLGCALVRAALSRLREAGARGVVLVGDPGYYARFGFGSVAGLIYPGVPEQYVLAVSLAGSPPSGVITGHKAFDVNAA